ncbi:MAG: PorT family protein [Chitinophagaceae bacterium]|jgi:hypothetical protein|nr:PorT family protein [Chitinophagaceae bacterium]
MKKMILTVFIAALTVAFANAQVKMVLLGGVNASNVRSAGIDSNQQIFSSTAGIAVLIPAGKKLYIKPEIQIGKKGYQIVQENAGNANFSKEFKQEINYIEFPVELVYPLKLGGGELMIAAGPTFAVALKGKQTKATVINLTRDERITNLSFGNGADEYKPLDIGGRINLLYAFDFGLLLKADYNYGFTNLSNNSTEYYNNSFGFSIGYIFPIGKKK